MTDSQAVTAGIPMQEALATNSSVIQLTHDLLKPSQKEEEETNKGVDWDFGNKNAKGKDTDAPVGKDDYNEEESDGDDKMIEMEPKKTSVFDIASISEDEKEIEAEEEKMKKEDEKQKKMKKALYTESELLKSYGTLFTNADRDQVTVKDIVLLLEKEYDCKLPKKDHKQIKKAFD